MRKITMIAAVVCCAGVLLGGIGTGVALVEYSSLEYTGRHILDEDLMIKETVELPVKTVEGKKILMQNYDTRAAFHFDESVPMDIIRFEVTYNPDIIKFRAEYDPYEEEELEEGEEPNPYQGRVRAYMYGVGSGFDLFMRSKDQILAELKQGKIGSYEVRSLDKMEIWVNPQMRDYVEF